MGRTPGRLLAAVVMAALLSSACGDRFAPPAAVVGGHRITQDVLQHEMSLVLTNPATAAEVHGPQGAARLKELTRGVLFFLIQLQVVGDYARTNGVSVTPSEVNGQLAQAIKQFGGQKKFDQELERRGLTAAQVRLNIQRNLLLSKVEDKVAGPATGNDQQRRDQAFSQWLAQRMRQLNVEVNPRFGRLVPSQGTILPITSTAA